MSEKTQFRDVLIKLALICLCAVLYAWGGYEEGPGKWVRRYLMPAVLSGSIWWFSRDFKAFLAFPLTILGASLGYGADNAALKLLKRFYCGLILGAGSASADWLNKRFLIAAFQTGLVTISMVILGVWNPMPDARTEELVIGFLICFLPVMSARKIK